MLPRAHLKNEPLKIFYKETLNEKVCFDTIDITPAKKGRRLTHLRTILLEPLYSGQRQMTSGKKRDKLDPLPYIPPIKYGFFTSLSTDTDVINEENPIIDRQSETESDIE